MAVNAKSIVLIGALGAGGYVAYEYYQYSSGMNTIANALGPDVAQLSTMEQALPFTTYLLMVWGIHQGTAAETAIFNTLKAALAGTLPTPIATQAPGTTSPTQTTSVSTAPTSTTTSTPPVTQTTTLPPISTRQTIGGSRLTWLQQNAPAAGTAVVPVRAQAPSTLSTQMEQTINMTTANADQWNYAYSHITGSNVMSSSQFDSVFGVVVNGARSSGTMTATVFLQKAGIDPTGTAALPHGLHGFGAIINYAGRRYSTTGNMIYQVHHPFPYWPTYSLKGLGGITQASGFEKTLLAGQPLRRSRIR